MEFERFITYMDYATIIFAFLAMFGTFYNIYNFKNRIKKIDIYFNNYKLNLALTRKECTRGEIQGILALFRKDMSKNYHIDFMGTIEYINLIYKIQANKLDEIRLILTDNELGQFRDELYKTNN